MAEGTNQPHGSESAPCCNTSSNSRTRISDEDESVELSNVLNMLGYGHELRQKRRECYKDLDRIETAQWGFGNCDFITVGSKAEGISRYLESDMDILCVNNFVKCIEAGCDINSIPENTSVCRMDTTICYPGHCLLLLERGFPLLLLLAMCDNGHGQILLSSDACVNILQMSSHFLRGPFPNERAGPSLPFTIGYSNADLVYAFRCHCPSILHRWASRSRHWPPFNIVEKVVSMGAFLTPVGFKGSENNHIEWRICFNTGEAELMINLNDAQIKLYVLLKMIGKDVLKPRHKEITSYMLKNIVLWLAEKNPQSMFHEKSLFFWIRESLLELRTALSKKQLPYYMIPERNLMAATGVTDTQNRRWIATLTDMLDEGPAIIRRLPLIRQAIISHPDPFIWYNTRRIELEIILLESIKSGLYSNGNYLVNMFDYLLRNSLMWRFVVIVNEVFTNLSGKEIMDTYSVFELFHIFSRFLM
ncbi:uncharacterized protein LOC127880244 [Dreissena polymorpha]|uniref:Mab-21-like HhH/H2TH-like domain-containing protein n=1 Tax=Dreissena polymorpha TaxID=45954 RepID=A0A9D4QKA4_DREPO|nr:uncharacterized protein LOC127880244 [Dreissena polymorpha]KAH3834239.1 hypothetical protein DPMN_107559 [Dreissena polymorpha]